jgi:hypothetical protein
MRSFAATPTKLYKQVHDGYLGLDEWRTLYNIFDNEYANAGNTARHVNMIAEMVSMVDSYLTVPSIKTKVDARQMEHAFEARQVAAVLDRRVGEMGLAETAEAAALDAMFAPITVLSFGRHAGVHGTEIDGEPMSTDESFCRIVDIDDLSLDVHARSWERRRFVAERICITVADLETNNPFGRDPEELAAAGEQPPVPVMSREEAVQYLSKLAGQIREQSNLRDDSLSTQNPNIERDIADHESEVLLWRVAIYEPGKVWEAYIADDPEQPNKFLLVQRWDGKQTVTDGEGNNLEVGPNSPDGPFDCLYSLPRRRSILGVPGLVHIYDLHKAGVKLSTKLINQLMKMKSVLAYPRGEKESADRIRKSQDDVVIEVTDPRKIITQKYGGADEQLPGAIEMLGSWFGNAGGGVRQMAGTQQSASLATTASFMQQGAQQRINKFRLRLHRLCARVVTKVAHMAIFANPMAMETIQMQMGVGPNGQPIYIPYEFNRAELDADALAFKFDIEPFTAPPMDPVMQSQRILTFLQVVGQNMQWIMQGVMDGPTLLEIGRVYFGIENASQLFPGLSGQQMMGPGMMGPGGGGMMLPPGQGGGGGALPQGQNRRIDAVRSAMAPQVPQ